MIFSMNKSTSTNLMKLKNYFKKGKRNLIWNQQNWSLNLILRPN